MLDRSSRRDRFVSSPIILPRTAEGRATIHAILPRKTMLSRKLSGKNFSEQVLVANVDVVFVVTAMNQDFNLRRIERYLAVVWESGARPVVLINKADLRPDAESFVTAVERVSPGVMAHSISALTGEGIRNLRSYLQKGQTAAFVGSSGVGKSSIINALTGSDSQHVQPIRLSDDRGKHATTADK
jgi:ribosome biogenesis GTPase / thiamine phosphate phosphatase